MDVREKLVEMIGSTKYGNGSLVGNNFQKGFIEKIASNLITHGVTVQEWILVKDRTPTESDGTVWVFLADVFPYNEKEPYIDAKHDRRITEAFYSQFSKRWYKDGAVLPDGAVTHWMEKAQPPKGE